MSVTISYLNAPLRVFSGYSFSIKDSVAQGDTFEFTISSEKDLVPFFRFPRIFQLRWGAHRHVYAFFGGEVMRIMDYFLCICGVRRDIQY